MNWKVLKTVVLPQMNPVTGEQLQLRFNPHSFTVSESWKQMAELGEGAIDKKDLLK